MSSSKGLLGRTLDGRSDLIDDLGWIFSVGLIDGEVIYVGRAFHQGDMLPAKVIPNNNTTSVCYAGKEILQKDFEVLRFGAFVWEYASNGSVPGCNGAIYKGSQTPGKVHPSHRCCYLPFDGAEVSVSGYEVLCVR